MTRRLMMIVVVFLVLIACVLVVAWLDGGRKDLRQITQPVALPQISQISQNGPASGPENKL